ncbi:hypothetical protein ACLB1R_20815 [Escherichia coli]
MGILAESLGMYVYFYDIENKLPARQRHSGTASF